MNFDYKHLGGSFLVLLAVALISWVAMLVGAVLNPTQFAFSYLLAFTFFFTVSIGALFWVMLHHMVDAEWSVGVRRLWENLASLLSTLGLLFIPLVFVAPSLWTWMQDAPEEKAAFLNAPFFWIRTALYFFIFTLLAFCLRSFSIAQDTDGETRWTILNRRAAFAGAAPFALCLSFAAIDWLMSLDAHWFSAIWGVYIFAGAILSALCVLVLVVTALRRVGYLSDVVTTGHYHLIGKLMLAFTIFWAYIAFSQYLLIWYANIPEEISYFALRNVGSWRSLSLLLAACHFLIPFLLLLPLSGKLRPGYLCAVAAWILLMHLLDLYLIIAPILHPAGASLGFLDIITFISVGSVLAIVFLKRLGDSALYPIRDPRLPECRDLQDE